MVLIGRHIRSPVRRTRGGEEAGTSAATARVRAVGRQRQRLLSGTLLRLLPAEWFAGVYAGADYYAFGSGHVRTGSR